MRIIKTGIADELCRFNWQNSIVYPEGPQELHTLLPVSESACKRFPGGRVFASRLASMAAALEYEGLGLFAFFGHYMADGYTWDLLDEDVAHRIRGVDDLNATLREIDENDYFLAQCRDSDQRWIGLVIAPLSIID